MVSTVNLKPLPNWSKFYKRRLYSLTNVWPTHLTREHQLEIEAYWKPKLKERDKIYSASVSSENESTKAKEKRYILSMFPYPSGKLHMGHVRVYTISDVLARFYRMNGKNVIHPMGWDAFGLPAENAAFDNGENPKDWTYNNINMMRNQLHDLCCSFDWHREFATCDPTYYKWTQLLFLKLHEAGLAYQKEAAVHWDPVDHTVLADEQIDANGCSWRSGAKVEKRFLKQWYIRATAFSKELFDGLDEVNQEQWRDVVDLQKHWIGECTGVRWQLKLKKEHEVLCEPLFAFTSRPEAIYGASHITLTKYHPLCQTELGTNVTVAATNYTAIHPLTGQNLPVFVNVEIDVSENQEALIGIPSVSEDDKKFAETHNLPYHLVYDENGLLKYPVELQGMTSSEAFRVVTAKARATKCGFVTSERARDWLISRQRYWGTPIPIVHCVKYGAVPVPENQLPVVLPPLSSQIGRREGSPLNSMHFWRQVKCARCDCDGYGLRETDTMDTFVDSSWYYLRYLDSKNTGQLVSKTLSDKYMPVDIYIGGKEHAIMHLYYARFVSHFLNSIGMVAQKEPFANLLTQGMVLGQSYRRQDTNKYLRPSEVIKTEQGFTDKSSGAAVIVDWEKMSKSKYNGIDPEAVIKEYGTDASRLCIVHNVAPKTDRNWTSEDFIGILRWQQRIWSLVSDFRQQKSNSPGATQDLNDFQYHEETIQESRNYFVQEVTRHIEKTFLLNVAVSRLQGFTNALKKFPTSHIANSKQFELSLRDLIIMMFPFSPLFACELWAGFISTPNRQLLSTSDLSIAEHPWPVIDTNDKPLIKVKVNSKTVATVAVDVRISSLTADAALDLVKSHPKLKNVNFTLLKSIALQPVSDQKLELLVKLHKEKGKAKSIE